jgi:hypothetical protein
MMRKCITMVYMNKVVVFFLCTLAGFLFLSPVARAQYSGTNYKIEEAQVGAVGGDNDLEGTSFQGRAGVGDTAIGLVAGATYQAVGGFTTSDIPELEVSVGTLNLNLGDATPSTTLTGVSSFGVRVYLSNGYTVYTRGGVPTNQSGVPLPGLAVNTTSTPGTEQFGINLVANTAPTTFGSIPQQLPDASFSFGSVAVNYNTANSYRYVDGEAIAQSTQSSGVTNYTVSYIVNIAPITDAGTYTMRHQMIVVGTY